LQHRFITAVGQCR